MIGDFSAIVAYIDGHPSMGGNVNYVGDANALATNDGDTTKWQGESVDPSSYVEATFNVPTTVLGGSVVVVGRLEGPVGHNIWVDAAGTSVNLEPVTSSAYLEYVTPVDLTLVNLARTNALRLNFGYAAGLGPAALHVTYWALRLDYIPAHHVRPLRVVQRGNDGLGITGGRRIVQARTIQSSNRVVGIR